MEPVTSQGRRGQIVLIGSDKGGVGKTTLAAGIAACFASRGPTTLIDTDISKDLYGWAATRAQDWPRLPQLRALHEAEALGDVACEEADRGRDVIIDVGGRDSELLRVAMSVADVNVIPVCPSQVDLFSCKRMAKRVVEVRRWNPKLRALFVINRADPNRMLRSLVEEAAEVCRSFVPHVELVDTTIYRRIAYVRGVGEGRGPHERGSDDDAAAELWSLVAEIDPTFGEESDDGIQNGSA